MSVFEMPGRVFRVSCFGASQNETRRASARRRADGRVSICEPNRGDETGPGTRLGAYASAHAVGGTRRRLVAPHPVHQVEN